jgi:hypothetical protein
MAEIPRRTHVECLASRTDAEVAALSADRLVFDLDLLFDKVLEHYGQHRAVEIELRATERLYGLATKHEDLPLARGLAEDAAYLAEVVPVYTERWSQAITQWLRYWRALRARVEALDPEAPPEGRYDHAG